MESPVPPCGREVYHKVAAPYFFIIMYIVQLYKEVWAILHMLGCRAIALPSTEQIDAAMQNGWIEKEEVESPVLPCGRGV